MEYVVVVFCVSFVVCCIDVWFWFFVCGVLCFFLRYWVVCDDGVLGVVLFYVDCLFVELCGDE